MVDPSPPKFKVAIVTTSFPLTKGSASGIFIEQLAKQLAHDAEVTVVTPAGVTVPDPPTCPAIHLVTFSYAPRSWQVLAHRPGGLPNALRRNPLLIVLLPTFVASMFLTCLRIAVDVDAIHANWSLNGVIAGLAGRLRGRPVVTTLRGSDVAMLGQSVIQRLMLRLAARLSDRLVAVGDSVRRRTQDLLGERARVVMIPNGVAPQFLRIPAPHAGDYRALTVTAVGNLVPEKGFETLIRAVAKLPNRRRMKIRIIGDGPERDQLKLLARSLGIDTNLQLVGTLPAEAMPKAYEDSDVLVLTSFSEGRSNVLVEALAGARATIATRIDGVSELIEHGENGLLYEPGDVDALVYHLETLQRDPELRARLGANGRARVLREGLTWDTAARRYVQLFAEVVGSRSARAA